MNRNTIGGNLPRSAPQLLMMVLMGFYLLYKIPIVAYYVNTYIALILFLITLALLLVYNTNLLTRSPNILLVLLLYTGFFVFSEAWEGASFIDVTWSTFLMFLPILMGIVITYNKRDYVVRMAAPLIIVLYTITAVTTYLGLLENPEASRLMAADPTAYHRYFPYNIGGFNFIYSFVLLHPLMVGVLKEKKLLVLSLAMSVIGGLCVIKSEYTTAAVLFLVSCVAYFLPSRTSKRQGRLRGQLVMVVLVVILLCLPLILEGLAETNLFEEASDKLRDIAGLLQGQSAKEDSTKARITVYRRSWETFLAHPLLGARGFASGQDGGHSFFLDTLAKWGIVGFSLIVVLYYQFRQLHRRISGDSIVSYYAVLFFCMVIVICILNPHAWTFELGLGAPLLLRYAVLVSEEAKSVDQIEKQD